MSLRVVGLHGFTGSPRSFDELKNHLAQDMSLAFYAPALLGHSGKTELGVFSFMAEVDRLAHLIIKAGMSGAHLLGYSLGGRMALGLMARHPQLFSGATLVGVHPGLARSDERNKRQVADEHWCQLLGYSMPDFVSQWSRLPLFATQSHAKPSSLAAQTRIRNGHDPRGLVKSLRTVGLGQMPNLWSVAQTWCRPLTLVVGENDRKFSKLGTLFLAPRESQRRPFPTHKRVISDCGHNLLLEAPEALALMLRGQA